VSKLYIAVHSTQHPRVFLRIDVDLSSRADVIILKNIFAKNYCYLHRLSSKKDPNTVFFKKSANFFAENGRKSLKIVFITLSLGLIDYIGT
jgi:hypothetical protein